MKAIAIWLFTLLIFTSCTNSYKEIDLANGKEVHDILASKWEAEYVENLGNRSKIIEEMAGQIWFNSNGTYTSNVKNGAIKQRGKWSYNPNTRILTVTIGSQDASSRILSLTRKKIIRAEYFTLNGVIRDSSAVTYKKL